MSRIEHSARSRKVSTAWLALELNDKDRAYYILGTQDHCPGGTFWTDDIGAIMCQDGDSWRRCFAPGWVTHDRKKAFVRFRDWALHNRPGDTATAQDGTKIELSRDETSK